MKHTKDRFSRASLSERTGSGKKINVRWQLVLYDLLILLFVEFLLLIICRDHSLSPSGMILQVLLTAACLLVVRLIGGVYQQVWRYGGVQCYLRLLVVDGCAFFVNLLLENLLPENIVVPTLLSICCMNLLGSLAIRMIYRYAYKCGNVQTAYGKFLNTLLRIFAGPNIQCAQQEPMHKTGVAIIGAGRTGVALAEELLNHGESAYTPRCFVDVNQKKADRKIQGIPVLLEGEISLARLKDMEVEEVIFALPQISEEERKSLYDRYFRAGYRIKIYDAPVMQTADAKPHIREFSILELLFRKPVEMQNGKTAAYYRDKVILITGGGGSIGSELCRQLARMQPKQIVILDIYENGAYDVQQELRIVYRDDLNIQIEITSICDRRAMERVFETYRPQIVINAAAHKHVPLMEHNCIEAVENNVFGTQNLVELCELYGAERFMMVSTDKAVNPTNVMGATKRMCEMIVQSASTYGRVKYSTTRFGNVLGSAGSVIPLFQKQIANGGPLTLTDRRIIRYFMTIPEASGLVLESGAMADNGELFVLDMGQPIKILDLAENMIRLSGAKGIEIVETGLRPGEKLYEELLVKTEELTKTENQLIFIERDTPLDKTEMDEKLACLRAACATGDNDLVRQALHQAVPTYSTPEEINATAEASDEMKMQRGSAQA